MPVIDIALGGACLAANGANLTRRNDQNNDSKSYFADKKIRVKTTEKNEAHGIKMGGI